MIWMWGLRKLLTAATLAVVRIKSLSSPEQAFIFTRKRRAIFRKEVIQPQVPLLLPCYDFTPVIDPTVVGSLHCWLGHRLKAEPTPMAWRAVCTRSENVFTAACWSAITSDSDFMPSSCRGQSELRKLLGICSALLLCFPLSLPL